MCDKTGRGAFSHENETSRKRNESSEGVFLWPLAGYSNTENLEGSTIVDSDPCDNGLVVK